MKNLYASFLALTLAVPLTASADHMGDRIDALEKRQAEIYHSLQEKREAGLEGKIAEHLTISGLIEVEAAYEGLSMDQGEDESGSDLTLATVALGLDAAVNDEVSGAILLLFEDGEDGVTVDEATIDYSRDVWSARFGLQYLPFGAYPSHMLSSPMTGDLGESQEVAVLLGYERDWASVSVFLYNGEVDRAGEEDHIKDWGASLVAIPLETLEVGASFLFDLAYSDSELVAGYKDRVHGWSAYGVVTLGPVEVLGEVLGSVGSFKASDLDGNGDGDGDRPFAWNVEAAFSPMETLELAARVEGSSEYVDQPELQFGVCASWGALEHVSLSLEYLRGEFGAGFGGGVDSRDLVTAQMAAEF